MLVLLNLLSTTNASGRSVLVGHLSRLLAWAGEAHEFVGLCHAGNRDLREILPRGIRWIECPAWTGRWFGRAVWERTRLGGVVRRIGADVLFMASGTVVETCRIPQVSLAMNPWCLVPAAWTSRRDWAKAWLQRRAYRSAVRRAALMVYLSRYLRDAYVANAGGAERDYVIAPAGLNDDVLTACGQPGARDGHRPLRIVCVSLMAPHKGVETVLEALALLRGRYALPAELHLVGGWPAPAYAQSMRALSRRLGLEAAVHIHGFVSRQTLFDHYAQASAFCLMSRCESFGIPAVEAQCFGTPVVSSNGCAIPEVCGAGGIYPAPADREGTAAALARLLTDPVEWSRYSQAAIANAARYTYDLTAKPLLKVLEIGARTPKS
jgi:glycosyltransferase involved in cell wall biosynthesis